MPRTSEATLSSQDVPWYKGCMALSSMWSSMEPENGVFDWDVMDDAIYGRLAHGPYVMLKIYQGQSAPSWIYANGVPAVDINGTRFPYYLDPDYKIYVERMIRSVAEHVAAYPRAIRERIIAVQATQGSTGDPHPWSGSPAGGTNSPYYIDRTGPEWEAWTKWVFQTYCDAYAPIDPKIHVIVKPYQQLNDWTLADLPDTWRKTSYLAQGYQLNTEMGQAWQWDMYRTFRNGHAIRARGEFTTGIGAGWYAEAPLWNAHWQCLWALNVGMDVLNISSGHMFTKHPAPVSAYAPSFEFFNRYAGYKDPRDSKGAWCALRDGLDASDKVRFPEAQFGAVENGRNMQRYLNIAASLSAFGAAQGDPVYRWMLDGATNYKKLNDVGFKIWPGNYGMYLQQHDPNGTSQGYWRQGSTNEPYGRFARGFRHADGKNRMYFDVDDGFFFDQPLNGQYPVTVRVIYLDQGTGTWALEYDAQGNTGKRAFTVTKTGSGTWKTRTVTLNDAYLGNRCPNGTDLMLVNTDSHDDIFHLVEITRETGDRKGYWGGSRDAQFTPALECQVSAGADDAEEQLDSHAVSLASSDLELGADGADQLVGLRFTNVTIPQGALIARAWIRLKTDEGSSETTELEIRAQAVDTAEPFAATPRNLSNRQRTAAFTRWTINHTWTTIGRLRDSADISAVVQEIVDRPDWQSGNALAILISGTGRRTAESYDGDVRGAPVLHIESRPPGGAGGLRALIPAKAAWRYDDSGTDLGTAWRAASYDDAEWPDGTGPLGYGTEINTLLSYGLDPADKRRTAYFRKHFFLDPQELGTNRLLSLRALFDDGFVAYLNGHEVTRQAMPGGTIAYNTAAAVHNHNETYETLDLTAHLDKLVAGENVLAVEVHQWGPTSSDLVMDMELLLTKVSGGPVEQPVAPRGSTWAYRKGTAEASSPATDWRRPGFDDSGWPRGTGPVGYSDYGVLLGTELPDMRGNYTSIFLRRTFNVSEPLLVGTITIEADFDDGFILLINGCEVRRHNVAGSPGSFVSRHATATANENGTLAISLAGAQIPVLRAGTNVLAAQMFNRSLTESGDSHFDAALSLIVGHWATDQDADQDGMPDAWEDDCLTGLSEALAQPAADPDNDGLSNLQEWIAGTNPRSEIGNLKSEIRASNGQLEVSFETVPATGPGYDGLNRCYALEQRAGLGPAGQWQIVPGYGNLLGQGQTIQHTNAGDEFFLYRARVWLEAQ